MVQSPSWEANWFAASQEILRISRKRKVHYRTHKRPPPVSILGQLDPVHTPSHPTSWRSILILSSHLHLCLPSDHLPSGFPTNPVHVSPLPHTRYMPCPSHSSPFYHPSSIVWAVQIIKLLVMSFSLLPCHFVPLRLKYSPQHPVLKHPLSTCYLDVQLLEWKTTVNKIELGYYVTKGAH